MSSTALIALASADRHGRAAGTRTRADFLAQLIAASVDAPQSRARRRAAPEEAIVAYATLERSLAPAMSGHALRRSL